MRTSVPRQWHTTVRVTCSVRGCREQVWARATGNSADRVRKDVLKQLRKRGWALAGPLGRGKGDRCPDHPFS
jgi:hypothetical protein